MDFLQDPTFAVLAAFVIFVGLLFKPIKKALGASLDEKIAQIRNEVDEAQRLREEAQATLAAYQRQQRSAKSWRKNWKTKRPKPNGASVKKKTARWPASAASLMI